MRRKKAEKSDASVGGRITPADVQQVEFRLAFRGYNERDVDAFLDRITEDLGAYIEENQRLRAGAPRATPDLSSARVEAERIVTEARQEAARIVREAEARAAVAGAAGDPRAAVAPFLSAEREFLQSLGSLVQGHAEEVKRMVADLRTAEAAADTAGSEPGAGPPETEPSVVPPEAEVDAGAPEPEPEPGTQAITAEEAFAPISVPAAGDEGTEVDESIPEPAPVQVSKDTGERSLRELFWGED